MDIPSSPFAAALGRPFADLAALFDKGGPAIWAIAALSVVTVALVLWKTWRLLSSGAFSGGRRTAQAAALWQQGNHDAALALVEGRRSLRARMARAAMRALRDPGLSIEAAEAETGRVARALLSEARTGLRSLELIATVAPLLGLLGTVMGMIGAFQALEATGNRADAAVLAGGIWEALLTTAAGMAVAIVASVALVWFESIAERLRHDMEDAATVIFLRARPRAALVPGRRPDAAA
ncbi:Ferric siderophore transport system, biopolymer transport protein ExbB [Rhodovulum sp. P5]|uniref:MotA/TolQ/ExbB proton channel family protein n=1 Tax=Rhodovulum sp. P5 TaxID=1564506 RepID=UPI0009C1BB36|nr:MotA/TolQ/ExbB proton channel family protein [Rhodovulum sp. P5]ARE39820.1 Ferric siderophore transport system, biopolymer transport protein ExbB [Rhodovulum sp. P5]